MKYSQAGKALGEDTSSFVLKTAWELYFQVESGWAGTSEDGWKVPQL